MSDFYLIKKRFAAYVRIFAAFFAALWIMVSAANWIFRPFRDSPALSLTATLSLVLVPWFIMAAVTYLTKGGRELLKMSYGDVKN